MGRKTETVVVPAGWGGRDAGKTFLITEMDASRAEKWGIRALLIVQNSGERIPDSVAGLGMVGVAIIGLNVFMRGNIEPEKLFPLMDEMMGCVQIIRDPHHPEVATAMVSEDDIEEVQTMLWLRSEVLRLHTGFSPAAALSSLISAIQEKASSTT